MKNMELRGVILGERPVVHTSGVYEKEVLGAQALATPILASKPDERGRHAGCAPWQSWASKIGALAVLLNGSSWRALKQKLGVEDVETEMVTHAAGTEMRSTGVGMPLAWGGAMVSNGMLHAMERRPWCWALL
ncbi:unnamed protein product [Ilex paraguariensis]|uniref:Uncharacterized protein n=1 Tax=Ilex paraguariensis TaxID=185542 RepID=A0ABC8RF87_9AQUA